MTVTFENRQMVITHSSGVVDRYNRKQMVEQKELLEQQRDDIIIQINSYADILEEIDKSVVISPEIG